MASQLVLVANPGSDSRKYALFDGHSLRGTLHFEWESGRVICSLQHKQALHKVPVKLKNIDQAATVVMDILRQYALLLRHELISHIGLRVVAPSSYFLQDHIVDDAALATLEEILPRAPLHITATLNELKLLRKLQPTATVVGVSDSAFHATKPDYAWNYGLDLAHADTHEIKRFGYHGLSVASVVDNFKAAVPARLIVCHLGSGASVTAVLNGKSIDTTMGYSPLEGVIMSTRSGSIDPVAVHSLQAALKLDNAGIADYLNHRCGLLGLSGTADMRELLQRDSNGDHRAQLALATYVHHIQKAIGQMAAALGGVDTLVFTGTVGERAYIVRERVTTKLGYLGFVLDKKTNSHCTLPTTPQHIQALGSNPLLVVPAQEARQIAKRTLLVAG